MSEAEKKSLDLLEYAEKNWRKKKGLAAALLSVAVLAGVAPGVLPLGAPWANVIRGVAMLACLPVTFCWVRSRRLPRPKKGRTGVVICISAEEETERKNVKADFVDTLRGLLRRGESGPALQILEVPEDLIPEIRDSEDAERVLRECRAHFILFGRSRLRTINGEEKHVLDLNFLVIHRPIGETLSKEFSKEFAGLLPGRVFVGKGNEFLGFEVTSGLVTNAAKYIIGVASAVSGDLDGAERLQRDVVESLSVKAEGNSIQSKLRRHALMRLAEIRWHRASECYRHWCESHDPKDILDVERHLSSIPQEHMAQYPVLLLSAIVAFLLRRDTVEARALLERCNEVALDGSWQTGLGFICAYEGTLRSACQCYDRAVEQRITLESISQVEDFQSWVLREEPGKYQLHFSLGYINRKLKEDTALAVGHFKAFLAHCKNGDFPEQKKLAEKWIAEMETPGVSEPSGAEMRGRSDDTKKATESSVPKRSKSPAKRKKARKR